MPTKTFFHLPEEKQQRLLEAAKIEFSRASLQDASIANIVKLAEIPRGSFYQYFEGKEDIYFYYFDSLRRNSKRDLEKELVAVDGDLLEAFQRYFTNLIAEVLTGSNADFYKHLFMNMDYRSSNRVTPAFSANKSPEHARRHSKGRGHPLYKLVNTERLNVKDEHEIGMLIQLLMSMVFTTITTGYKKKLKNQDYDSQIAIEEFQKKINWLKNGVYIK